jgi:hypothetical protein
MTSIALRYFKLARSWLSEPSNDSSATNGAPTYNVRGSSEPTRSEFAIVSDQVTGAKIFLLTDGAPRLL